MALTEQLQELKPHTHCHSLIEVEQTLKKVRSLSVVYGKIPVLSTMMINLSERRNQVLFS